MVVFMHRKMSPGNISTVRFLAKRVVFERLHDVPGPFSEF